MSTNSYFSNMFNSSMGVGGMAPFRDNPTKPVTNIKEKNGEACLVHEEPTVTVIDEMRHFGADIPDADYRKNVQLNNKPISDQTKSESSLGSKKPIDEKPVNDKTINMEIRSHIDIFINEIQQNKPNYNRLYKNVNHVANNIIETSTVAIQMGGNPKTWNRINQIGQGLNTFSTNLNSLSSLAQNGSISFSIEMCSNYWSMAVGAMSILSSILNDDEDEPDERFEYLFKSLNEIQNALKLGFERLESILINCVCERLAEIYGQLIRMETIMCDSFRDIHRKDLLNITDAIKKDLSGEFIQTNTERRDLLLKLSTWIDCHCSSSIETAKNRFCIDSPQILIDMLQTASPSFIINLTNSLINEPESIPNVDICLSACKLFAMAHKKWKIEYNTKLLYGRVIGIIDDAYTMIECFNETDVETLIRQMNHYRFMIGRAIARVGFEVGKTQMVDQINKMTNKDEVVKLIDSIELRRIIIVKMCEIRGIVLKHKLISKEEYLRTVPNIDSTPNRKPYYGGGLPYVPTRSPPTGGHLVAHGNKPEELLNYLEYGLNVNAHCGWGNVLLNCMLNTKPHPQCLHSLLKCPELDSTSGQMCKTDMGSTWPIGTGAITYALNCAHLTSAILLTANGYNIDSTNYGTYHSGGHWGDCGNLHRWASEGDKNSITTLEVVKSMEDKNSFWYRDKLRVAYKYYKEYESGLNHTSEKMPDYTGDIKSLFVFSCMLGLVPPAVKCSMNQYYNISMQNTITKSGLKWSDLSKYNGTPLIEWENNANVSSETIIDSNYANYLKVYKNKLDEMIKTESVESNNPYLQWIELLEPICKTINKPIITETFQLVKSGSDIKRDLNLLNALLKQEPTYNLGVNIDILLST